MIIWYLDFEVYMRPQIVHYNAPKQHHTPINVRNICMTPYHTASSETPTPKRPKPRMKKPKLYTTYTQVMPSAWISNYDLSLQQTLNPKP